MSRNTTRLRHLQIDIADLQWATTVLPAALERAHRDTHPGIAPNGPTANDGSHPGPTAQLAITRALDRDQVARDRDHTHGALQQIHTATQTLVHALHRLLPMNPADARLLAEGETVDPTPLPCANPHCTQPAEQNRSQCAACRKYRARHGADRPAQLTTKGTPS